MFALNKWYSVMITFCWFLHRISFEWRVMRNENCRNIYCGRWIRDQSYHFDMIWSKLCYKGEWYQLSISFFRNFRCRRCRTDYRDQELSLRSELNQWTYPSFVKFNIDQSIGKIDKHKQIEEITCFKEYFKYIAK